MHTSNWWKKAFNEDYFEFFSELIPLSRSKKEVRFIIKKLRLKKGTYLLDAPCGYGRHSFVFAKNKIYVTGVDYSSFLIQKAKEQCRSVSSYVNFQQADLQKLSYKNRFHAIVNLFSSFGYSNKKDDENTLKIFYNALKQKGRLLLDLPNTPRLIKRIPTKEWFTTSKGQLCDEIIKLDAKQMKACLRLTTIRGKKKRIIKGTLRLYTFPEIKKMLKDVGFQNIFAWGDFSDKAYNIESPRMIIIAQK